MLLILNTATWVFGLDRHPNPINSVLAFALVCMLSIVLTFALLWKSLSLLFNKIINASFTQSGLMAKHRTGEYVQDSSEEELAKNDRSESRDAPYSIVMEGQSIDSDPEVTKAPPERSGF